MLAFAAFLLAQAAPLPDAPAPAAPATATEMPTGTQMVAQIEANDAKLFWAFFEGCDPDSVADLVHPDFRMIHDLAGLPLASGADMIEQSREQCAAREPGGENEGYRNRRLLVPGSRTIEPLGTWGVLEEGHHTFHELRQRPAGAYGPDDPGGPTWVQTGGGRYLHVWQWMPEEGRFRLLESLSIDHGPAPQYPPDGA